MGGESLARSCAGLFSWKGTGEVWTDNTDAGLFWGLWARAANGL